MGQLEALFQFWPRNSAVSLIFCATITDNLNRLATPTPLSRKAPVSSPTTAWLLSPQKALAPSALATARPAFTSNRLPEPPPTTPTFLAPQSSVLLRPPKPARPRLNGARRLNSTLEGALERRVALDQLTTLRVLLEALLSPRALRRLTPTSISTTRVESPRART